jgi:hypothetical protein
VRANAGTDDDDDARKTRDARRGNMMGFLLCKRARRCGGVRLGVRVNVHAFSIWIILLTQQPTVTTESEGTIAVSKCLRFDDAIGEIL